VLYYQDEITNGVEYSNKSGEFSYHGGLAGATFKCPDITLYFYKEGYKPLKVTCETGTSKKKILLQRNKRFEISPS
jgi:hypothetical protein